jgi:hypothetical protein
VVVAPGRSLPILAAALSVLAGVAWALYWVQTATAYEVRFVGAWLEARHALAVAAVAGWVLWAGLGGIGSARRDGAVGRSLRRLQSVAAALLAITLLVGLFGDASSTIIGLGLVGFGLTLALQRPILAVAGWATIVFNRMFREGDRIQVGSLHGDVLDIGLFTTRLWEIGEPDSVTPSRPTGRIRILSNALFLEQPVANATSDTPVIFDEFVVTAAYESDLALARRLLEEAGARVLDPSQHEQMAKTYRRLPRGLLLEAHFPDRPLILVAMRDSWVELRLRFLVPARQRGATRSKLVDAWLSGVSAHADALPNVYPRSQPQRVGADGRPLDPGRPN